MAMAILHDADDIIHLERITPFTKGLKGWSFMVSAAPGSTCHTP